MSSYLYSFLLLFLILQLSVESPIATLNTTPIQNPLSTIEALKNKLQVNMNYISDIFPRITRNLQSQIENNIKQLEIPQILLTLFNNIETIAQTKDTRTSNCIRTARNELESLKSSSRASVDECVAAAAIAADRLTEAVEVVLQKGNKFRVEITERVGKCVKNNLANELGLALCLLAQVQPIQEALAVFEDEVGNAVSASEIQAQNIAVELGKCLVFAQRNAGEKSNSIFGNLQQCVNL